MNTIKVIMITAAATDVIIAAILTPLLLDTVIFVACVVRTVPTAYLTKNKKIYSYIITNFDKN